MASISFGIPSDLQISGSLTVATNTTLSNLSASTLTYLNASKVVSSVTLNANITLTAGTLALNTALVSINSITSVAGQNITLGCGTGGVGLTITTTTLAATFASTVSGAFNGTIGATTPAAGAFTTVNVATAITSTANAVTLTPTTNILTQTGGANPQYVLTSSGGVTTSIYAADVVGGAILQTGSNHPVFIRANGGLVATFAPTTLLTTLAGNLTVSGTGASTLGAAGSVFTFNGAVASTSTSTGTVVISGAGGLAVGGAIYAGALSLFNPSAGTDALSWKIGSGRTGYMYADANSVGINNVAAFGGEGIIFSNTAHSLLFYLSGAQSGSWTSSLLTIPAALTMSGTLTGASTLTGTNTITAAASTALTLTGGSSGPILTLGQGLASGVTITSPLSNPVTLTLVSTAGAGAEERFDSTAGSGRVYTFVSTGSANGLGAGYFALYDITAGALRWSVSSSGANNFTGTSTFSNATASTSSTTGSLLIGNGSAATNVGIGAGAIYAGAGINSVQSVAAGNALSIFTNSAADGTTSLRIGNTGASGVSFDMGVGGNTNANTSLRNKFYWFNIATGLAARLDLASGFDLYATTEATSASAASLTTAGGMAIAKSLIVGGGTGLGVTNVTTAAGTTTLTAASTTVIVFVGTSTQSVQLPATNALGAGIAIVYVLKNRSSGSVTILRAGSDTIEGATQYVLPGGSNNAATLVGDGVSAWQLV